MTCLSLPETGSAPGPCGGKKEGASDQPVSSLKWEEPKSLGRPLYVVGKADPSLAQ